MTPDLDRTRHPVFRDPGPVSSPPSGGKHGESHAHDHGDDLGPPDATRDVNALPPGTRLGEFEIESVLAKGGFGIVYTAYDHSLDRRVAVKEYMPSSLARRAAGMSVSLRSKRHLDTFQTGLRSFVNEARMLAQFDHPALLKVHRFWEANGTAYMAMPLYDGRTLKQALAAMTAPPDEAWLKGIVGPLVDALRVMHARRCYHRDISPDNILVLGDGRPLLLDFGAARHVIAGRTQALTVILKPGYAPIEQYAEDGAFEQGPWTDVYGLAAVLYFTTVGRPPVPAVTRVVKDGMARATDVARGHYGDRFLAAIDRGLAVRPADRTRDIDAFALALALGKEAPARSRASPGRRSRSLSVALGVAAFALAAVVGTTLALRPAAVPPAPVQAETRPPFDAVRALDAIFEGRDRDFAVAASVAQPQVRVGIDNFAFTIRSARPGYVYLLMVGTDRSHFYMLFPNAIDRDNRVDAQRELALPRASWKMVGAGPAGTNHFVAIVSDTPRDFTDAGLQATESIAEFPPEVAGARHAAHTAQRPLFAGRPRCEQGTQCVDRYGAAVFSIEEIEAPAEGRK